MTQGRLRLVPALLAPAFVLALSVPATSLGQDAEDPVEAVEEELGFYPSPKHAAYLDDLGQRLTTTINKSDVAFSFHIVDHPEPNAFAFPTGEVFITRGLVLLTTSEDELATLLGHEITHITREHARRGQRQNNRISLIPKLLSVPGRIVGRLVSDDLGKVINSPFTFVRKFSVAKYSRNQEREADRTGMSIAARHGYDASALSTILDRMQREANLLGAERNGFRYYASHPTTRTRLKDVESNARKIASVARDGQNLDRASFLQMLDGMFVGENPARGFFRGQQFLSPQLGVSFTFPEGWQILEGPGLVGAASPADDALVTLTVAGAAADPQEYGLAFLDEFEHLTTQEPSLSKHVSVAANRRAKVGSLPAYLVTIKDSSGEKPMDIHLLWVVLQGITYQIGSVETEFNEALRPAWLSLRPMSYDECRAVTVHRMRLATANANETLAALGRRTGNVWTIDYTAMINDIDPKTALTAGTKVKFAREERIENACPARK